MANVSIFTELTSVKMCNMLLDSGLVFSTFKKNVLSEQKKQTCS